MLLTTQRDADARTLLAGARSHGVPEIQVPRVIQVVPGIPLLGSGKVDYPHATRLLESAPASELV